MKEHILKYVELIPDTLYNDLVKIFGLSLDKLLDITNYKIEDKYIEIYDTKDNCIAIYDISNNIIYKEISDGYWVKYEYDKYGKLVKTEDSIGNILNY